MNHSITVLSPNVEQDDRYMRYYEYATESHFWIRWRFQMLWQLIQSLNIPTYQALHGLDVGCGNGVVRRQIEQTTDWIMDGTDLSLQALRLNNACRGQTFLYDISDCHHNLKERYDIIILFDVLEHIDDTKAFLESLLYHIKPGGWLFINVPALKLLFSNYDRAQEHLRRYDCNIMRQELLRSSLAIHDMRYWGASLIPFLFVRKCIVSRTLSLETVFEKGFKAPNKWVNACFMSLMRFETGAIKNPILGTSLMTAAMKRINGFESRG